ncbi:MAG: sulfotransferase [Gammaproteobacteria bacterium]
MRTEVDHDKGRSKVSKSSESSAKTLAAPKVVFVVGAPRSGTSIVWLALTRALKATHYGEGHMMHFFKGQLAGMLRDFGDLAARQYKGMLAAETTPRTLEKHYANMIRQFYNEAYRASHIVDKTPSLQGVETVPFARKTFPSAKFVFCHRRALENVESRIRKWPGSLFESHCREWSAIMSKWRSLRSDLPEELYLEVDQQSIAIRPEKVAQSLGVMIDLESDQTAVIAETFATRETAMIVGSAKTRVLDLDAIDWDADQKRIFLDICGEELTAWSYTLDGTYRKALASSQITVLC